MSDVRGFGAAGDGQMDDTEALQHALNDGEGTIVFPRGTYRITRPLVVDLAKRGRTSINGDGGTAKLIMAGPGPAIRLLGTHGASADPTGFRPQIWEQERMPTISQIEIEGAHAEADGVQLEGVMQPTLTGVLIRKVRTGVHVTQRARNVLISHCHIYHNTGIGIHLDGVNLHQTIITGSHISYCRLGGIRIEGSEIRNLQITGNDIEYNNNRAHKVPDADAEPTAEIYIDSRTGTVREGTIASNTIQATYSPGGANIRFIGNSPEVNHKTGMWTIAGNLIGSQDYNIHLTSARAIAISGNVMYSGHTRNLLIEHCRNIAVGSNVFDHNPDYGPKELCTGIRIVDSVDCALTGVVIQDCQCGQHSVKDAKPVSREALIELVRCKRMNLSGLQVLDGAPYGIFLDTCENTLLTGSMILDGRDNKLMKAAVRWQGAGRGNMISGCRLGSGTEATVIAEKHVRQVENLGDE